MDNELKKKIDGNIGNMLIDIGSLVIRKKAASIPKEPGKILLIKFWGIGNIIMLTPAMKAIRKRYPQSEIYFLTLSKNRGLLEELDYVDRVFYYELGAFDMLRIIRLIYSYGNKFDIVIDFEQFLNISSIISYFLGKYAIGFSNRTRSRHKLYNSVEPCSESRHVAEQFYDLCVKIGIPPRKKALSLEKFDFITQSEKADNFFRENGIGDLSKSSKNIIIGVHIGSSENAEWVKRWPESYFARLINLLNERIDNLIFVMTGSEPERRYASRVIERLDKNNAYNSCGVFGLRDLIYFMKKCSLFISNDTGPIHIAAACRVKCAGFYGPTSPVLYGPYGNNNLIFYEKMECSPCINNYSSKSTVCKSADCMKNILPEDAAKAIAKYIIKYILPG